MLGWVPIWLLRGWAASGLLMIRESFCLNHIVGMYVTRGAAGCIRHKRMTNVLPKAMIYNAEDRASERAGRPPARLAGWLAPHSTRFQQFLFRMHTANHDSERSRPWIYTCPSANVVLPLPLARKLDERRRRERGRGRPIDSDLDSLIHPSIHPRKKKEQQEEQRDLSAVGVRADHQTTSRA